MEMVFFFAVSFMHDFILSVVNGNLNQSSSYWSARDDLKILWLLQSIMEIALYINNVLLFLCPLSA